MCRAGWASLGTKSTLAAGILTCDPRQNVPFLYLGKKFGSGRSENKINVRCTEPYRSVIHSRNRRVGRKALAPCRKSRLLARHLKADGGLRAEQEHPMATA